MRIYSDKLTDQDIRDATQGTGAEIRALDPIPRAKVRSRGWKVKLGSWDGRPFNTGLHGAGEPGAASWDQWGAFLAELYSCDPDARLGPYKGREDFHARTEEAYRLPAEATLPKVYYECGICECVHPWEFDGDCRDNANRITDERIIYSPKSEVRSWEDRLAADKV